MNHIFVIRGRTADAMLKVRLCLKMSAYALSSLRGGADFTPVTWEAGLAAGFSVGFQAFEKSGLWRSQSGSRAAIVGDPVLPRSNVRDFETSISNIAGALLDGTDSVLRDARGSYAGYAWDPVSGVLTGVTDKLGVRALYVLELPEATVLSTSVVLATAVLGHHAAPNLQAALEAASFGFVLGDETPTSCVTAIPPACRATITSQGVSVTQYWNWNRHCEENYCAEANSGEFHRVFLDAVRLRSGSDTTALAFLSGGLDSRAVVAALRQSGLQTVTVGMGAERSADRVLSAEAAKALGCRKHAQLDFAGPGVQQSTAEAYRTLAKVSEPARPERSRVVWSGDGGSVALGHVYLTDALVRESSSQPDIEWLDQLSESLRWRVPRTILTKEAARSAANEVQRRLAAILSQIAGSDLGRRMHRLLMSTDQRWHLQHQHETILEQGFEMALPFFDSEVVSWVLSRPATPFLHHRFYNQWINHFGESFASVPWQSYPGHLDSPALMPTDLKTQWVESGSSRLSLAQRFKIASEILSGLSSKRLPAECSKLRVAAVALVALADSEEKFGHATHAVQGLLAPYRSYKAVEST